MPGRNFDSQEYRYGFQGQEKDSELKGEGLSVNYKYRMHDPRVGRFFAVDPIGYQFPWNSTYAFSENKLTAFVELEGLESFFAMDGSFIGTIEGSRAKTNHIVSDELQNQFKNMINYLNNYKYSELHTYYSRKLMDMSGIALSGEMNSFLESSKPKHPINTNIAVKPSLLSSNPPWEQSAREFGEDLETTGDIITVGGVVTAPFGGFVVIPLGEAASNTGTGIQIIVDIAEDEVGDAIVRGVSTVAPSFLSRPLRKMMGKYFDKMTREAIEKGDADWVKALDQGRNVIDTKITIFEFSVEKGIEKSLQDDAETIEQIDRFIENLENEESGKNDE